MSAACKKSKSQQLKERWENGELDCGAQMVFALDNHYF